MIVGSNYMSRRAGGVGARGRGVTPRGTRGVGILCFMIIRHSILCCQEWTT